MVSLVGEEAPKVPRVCAGHDVCDGPVGTGEEPLGRCKHAEPWLVVG